MILAGAGLFLASFFLQILTKNSVLKPFPEIVKLVPLLLGLKGSIEMTYASRLGTLANIRKIDAFPKFLKAALFNFALILGQAITVTLLAACIVLTALHLSGDELTSARIAAFFFTVLLTATIASMVLAFLITCVVRFAQWRGINPDNICSPIAATAGDSCAVLILNYSGTVIYQFIPENISWICVGLIILTGVGGVCIAVINKDTREALTFGSISIVISMLIGIGVGHIFQNSVEKYPSASLYILILNGIGGNLVSILASRTATNLHKMVAPQREIVQTLWYRYLNPLQMWKNSKNRTTLISLLIIGTFVQMAEMVVIFLTSAKSVNDPLFSVMYIGSCVLQYLILFYVCYLLTHLLFSWNINPDNNAIPLLTAIGDLTGTLFLALSLYTHYSRNKTVSV